MESRKMALRNLERKKRLYRYYELETTDDIVPASFVVCLSSFELMHVWLTGKPFILPEKCLFSSVIDKRSEVLKRHGPFRTKFFLGFAKILRKARKMIKKIRGVR